MSVQPSTNGHSKASTRFTTGQPGGPATTTKRTCETKAAREKRKQAAKVDAVLRWWGELAATLESF